MANMWREGQEWRRRGMQPGMDDDFQRRRFAGGEGYGQERDYPRYGGGEYFGEEDFDRPSEFRMSDRMGRGYESESYADQGYGERGFGGGYASRGYMSGAYGGPAFEGRGGFGSRGFEGGSFRNRGYSGAGIRGREFQGGGFGEGGMSRREGFAGKGPKNYTRSDDRITEDINDRLTDDWQLDASELEVQVRNGEVILSGTVPHRDDKRRAEDIAEACSGVKNVQNNIRVSRLSESGEDMSSEAGLKRH